MRGSLVVTQDADVATRLLRRTILARVRAGVPRRV